MRLYEIPPLFSWPHKKIHCISLCYLDVVELLPPFCNGITETERWKERDPE